MSSSKVSVHYLSVLIANKSVLHEKKEMNQLKVFYSTLAFNLRACPGGQGILSEYMKTDCFVTSSQELLDTKTESTAA